MLQAKGEKMSGLPELNYYPLGYKSGVITTPGDFFTKAQAKEVLHRCDCHDELVTVSHNLAKTMGIDYAIKKLSTSDDDMAIGAAVILKGIQQQAKIALAKAEKEGK